MKKIILLILVIGFSQTIKAIEIENIAVSAVSNQQINVRVNTMDLNSYAYNSYQYDISGNTITLEICYSPGLAAVISYLENNFQIPINTTIPANYLLIVKVYYINLQNFNCDYQIVRDIENLPFSTPLSGTIYLAINNVIYKTNNSILYPNPTTGILFCDEQIKVDKIEIYDSHGRLSTKMEKIGSKLDINNLEDGIYYVKIEIENVCFIEKIILKK